MIDIARGRDRMDGHPRAGRRRSEREQGVDRAASALRHPLRRRCRTTVKARWLHRASRPAHHRRGRHRHQGTALPEPGPATAPMRWRACRTSWSTAPRRCSRIRRPTQADPQLATAARGRFQGQARSDQSGRGAGSTSSWQRLIAPAPSPACRFSRFGAPCFALSAQHLAHVGRAGGSTESCRTFPSPGSKRTIALALLR